MKKRVAILGSTGSIGTQALEVIGNYPDKFDVEVLTSNVNAELLVEQAIKFVPSFVVIVDENQLEFVKDKLKSFPITVFSGSESISQVVKEKNIDIVLTAMVGYSGLLPTINAIQTGKDIALANKETLVVAGGLITRLAREHHVNIYPVDSEHSAIFQCLSGEQHNPIEKIYLTASGGPFRSKTLSELKNVTKNEALIHPNWCMGDKVTIDSASMMNKGLEAIEAKWLFNLTINQIDVIIHPQSIVHSLVQFEDGSMKAQLGLPDMKLPIQYALTYPDRLKTEFPRFNFVDYPKLTFEPPDTKKFRNLALSFEAMNKGGNVPCIMNAANELVVEAFLQEKISFLQMPEIIEKVMEKIAFIKEPLYHDFVETDTEARKYTLSLI